MNFPVEHNSFIWVVQWKQLFFADIYNRNYLSFYNVIIVGELEQYTKGRVLSWVK